jgi:hypothetical protein
MQPLVVAGQASGLTHDRFVAIRLRRMPLVDGLGSDIGTALHGKLRQLFIGRFGIPQESQDERPRQRQGGELPFPDNDPARLSGLVGDRAEEQMQRRDDLGYNPKDNKFNCYLPP